MGPQKEEGVSGAPEEGKNHFEKEEAVSGGTSTSASPSRNEEIVHFRSAPGHFPLGIRLCGAPKS
jgi:hypothetical protein